MPSTLQIKQEVLQKHHTLNGELNALDQTLVHPAIDLQKAKSLYDHNKLVDYVNKTGTLVKALTDCEGPDVKSLTMNLQTLNNQVAAWLKDLPVNYQQSEVKRINELALEIAKHYLANVAQAQKDEILRLFKEELKSIRDLQKADRESVLNQGATAFFDDALFKDNTRVGDAQGTFAEKLFGKKSTEITKDGHVLTFKNGKLESKDAKTLANAIAAYGQPVILGDAKDDPALLAKVYDILTTELNFPADKITFSGNLFTDFGSTFSFNNPHPFSTFLHVNDILEQKIITAASPNIFNRVVCADNAPANEKLAAKIDTLAQTFLRIQDVAKPELRLSRLSEWIRNANQTAGSLFDFITMKDTRTNSLVINCRTKLMKGLTPQEQAELAIKVCHRLNLDALSREAFCSDFIANHVSGPDNREAFREKFNQLKVMPAEPRRPTLF